MIVLAHAGHWAISVLYVAPVLLVVVALLVASRLHAVICDDEGDER